jgi:CBS domain-containing protein
MRWRAWLGLALGSAALVRVARRRRRRGGSWGRIEDVMVGEVRTISASATLMDAAQTMRDANVGMLPVIDGEGVLRGLITDRDLVVRAMAQGADPTKTLVAECATRDLVCARRDSPIEEALEVMGECQIGRLPVVDFDNRVIGIVTLSSLALRSRDDEAEALHTAQAVSRRSARVA